MIRMPVLGPRCHTAQVMQGGKTNVPICNTTKLTNTPEAWQRPTWPANAATREDDVMARR
jgi:hypothetical protein